MQDERRMLRPGENCWRIARADRFAVIVDAQQYFRAVKQAVLSARHAVYFIGWDFDTRVEFERGEKTLDGPNALGPFIRWIDRHRPDLRIHILKWDVGLVFELARGTTPLAILGWLTSNRVSLRLDSAHPVGAAQHQKIVVVDDSLAFCGGIDITVDRWDTRAHRDGDQRRARKSGARYDPWHDATTMVDGDLAKALGVLARTRWLQATGERIEAPPPATAPWPREIAPLLTDVDVGIARTVPACEGVEPVSEIEALYLDAIAAAASSIYCESQYFASRRIAEAMAERLQDPDGPEIVVINPQSADGYLEAAVMDTARARLLELIDRADRYDRFRIYTPVTDERQPIYVHAKIMVVDDRLLRVGSSNFNNRSLGFDVECDLVFEAPPGDDAVRGKIAGFRNDLLAEHLGVAEADVAAAVRTGGGSLVKAIEALIGSGKSLVPYQPDEPGPVEAALGNIDFLDPEQASSGRRRFLSTLRRSPIPLR